MSKNTESYIAEIRKRATPTGHAMDTIKDIKATELQNLMVEKEINKLEREMGGSSDTAQFLSGLLKDKSPEDISKFLRETTPEDVQKLKLLTSGSNDAILQVLKQQQQGQQQNNLGAKDVIELFVAMEKLRAPPPPPPPQKQETMADMMTAFAAMMKAVKEEGGGKGSVETLLETTVKPLIARIDSKDRELWDAKLETIKAGMPPPLEEQIKYVKDTAEALGMSGSNTGTSDMDLKLEELKQNREVDIKKLDWEQEKWKMDKEADGRKWDQIGEILKGPLGDVVKSLGSAGADRVRGGKERNNGGNPGKMPKPIQTKCPQCGNAIYVDADADTAVCGSCGSILQKQGGVPPAPAIPTHVETPASSPEKTVTQVKEEKPTPEVPTPVEIPIQEEETPTQEEEEEPVEPADDAPSDKSS